MKMLPLVVFLPRYYSLHNNIVLQEDLKIAHSDVALCTHSLCLLCHRPFPPSWLSGTQLFVNPPYPQQGVTVGTTDTEYTMSC